MDTNRKDLLKVALGVIPHFMECSATEDFFHGGLLRWCRYRDLELQAGYDIFLEALAQYQCPAEQLSKFKKFKKMVQGSQARVKS